MFLGVVEGYDPGLRAARALFDPVMGVRKWGADLGHTGGGGWRRGERPSEIQGQLQAGVDLGH